MSTEVKEILIKTYNNIGKIKRFYIPLQRLYEILQDELKKENLDKNIILQMAVKAINNTAGPERLISILLVFGVYPRINALGVLSPFIVVWANTIYITIKEV